MDETISLRDELKKTTILYVEDEPVIRTSLQTILARKCKEVLIAQDGSEGLNLFLEHRPPIVITDIRMPAMNGLDMSREIKKIDPDTHIIITSAFDDREYLLSAITIGVNQYVMKPVILENLMGSIEGCLATILLQRKIKEQNNIIQKVLDFQDIIVFVTDGEKISIANRCFLNFFQVDSLEEFHDKFGNFSSCFMEGEGYLSPTDGNWIAPLKNHDETAEFKVKVENPLTGVPSVLLLKFNNFPDHDTRRIVSLTDITSLEEDSKRYLQQSTTDPLTGIDNRLKFDTILETEIRRSKRYDTEFSVIMFDVDHFKEVNDTLGHLCGDNLLIELTALIKKQMRQTDVFARWGGDEFMILSLETKRAGAVELAEKLRHLIELTTFPEGGKVTCSFGVTQFMKGDTVDTLLKRADRLLYEAKQGGRNRVATQKEEHNSE